MRDRRNTNLSTSSAGSTNSSTSAPPRASLNEKRYTSPPPDKGLLPLPVTKENKSRPLSRRNLVLRYFAALFTFLWLLHWGLSYSAWTRSTQAVPETTTTHDVKDLPEEPTALLVTDKAGEQRWTVSIPANAPFPLKAGQYQDICTQSEALSSSFAQRSRLERVKEWRRKSVYYREDPAYLDVAEAQRTGVLPASPAAGNQTCQSSMTFSMATDDVSFGKTLLLLWMSYGLAKKEGRAFFIDDSHWPYGSYTTYFLPPPSQGCTPPPRTQIVPCPHTAQHIVVSAATAPWTFGPAFKAEFATPRYGLERGNGGTNNHHTYALLRAGYEALFHLFGDDAKYVAQRTRELSHPQIALQIRRGDLHPFEYEYSRDYLPLERYASAAHRLLSRLQPHPSGEPATLLLASDDPTLPTHPDLLLALLPNALAPAQTRIQLATKAALDASSPAEPIRAPGSAYVKHVDENAGWDGGFYPSLFASLAGPQESRVRELVGRGFLLDLAVAGSGEGVVCAVSGAACRVLGVMVGWEGVGEGRWANFDDGRGWSWDGRG
ncbi:hypothetical protein WHR41_02993 [Cladosporium halotolerans]|uniref:Uncharacterized protein n=1 Tax=Cladosporium halotolerans TaxID=1052096 RepID=A0AB34KZC9_9PEZI